MVEVLNFPITYESNKTNPKTFGAEQADASKTLARLLNRGYEIISDETVRTHRGTFIVYILYRKPRSKKNSVAPADQAQNHAA